jgi:class 3 adenylate cyclase
VPPLAAAAGADGDDGLLGLDPATAQIAIKGGSALAGAGIIGAGTYMASSSLLTGSLPNYATVGSATLAFLLAYMAIFALLLSEQEAREIRQLFTPARKPQAKPAPKRKSAPAAAPRKAAPAEAPAKPEEPEFAIRPERVQALQRAHVWVITFLHQSLAAVVSSGRHLANGRLDRATSLACQLFFAGVCEGYAHERSLDHSELRWLLREGLAKIAFDTAGARSFALHYPEYLVKPRCFEIVRAGVEGIQAHLKGDLRGLQALLSGLDRYQQRKSAPTKEESVAVLFTKLVRDAARPELEQQPEWASLVKTHDDIVRAAFMGSAGREVRHMGDGIMGVFQRPRDAVNAAAEIQRFAIGYNARREKHELHLRVGVAAGRLAGDAPLPAAGVVALAQRLVGDAGSEEILISEAVKAQMAGANYPTMPKGPKLFRGFTEPVTVFQVRWHDDPILRVS